MIERFCVDCKHHILAEYRTCITVPDRCQSPSIPRDPVTGQRPIRLCSYRRNDPVDSCGPAGLEWEAKGET